MTIAGSATARPPGTSPSIRRAPLPLSPDFHPRARARHRSSHSPLLGTVVDITVEADDAACAEATARLVLTEISRLERVFSAFDDRSELCRWRRGELPRPGPELNRVLADALDWQLRSDGAFNPSAGALTRLWAAAEAGGIEPDDATLDAVATAIAVPAYAIVDGVATAISGRAEDVQLNAIAKGAIVDLAVAAAMAGDEAALVVVGAGGDVLVRGGTAPVGIENPLRPYDNEPPLVVVEVGEAALATSGGGRRGFRVGGRWFGHVIDPRTERPVHGIAGVTVVASDAATADVAATIVDVLGPVDGLAWIATEPDLGCLLIDDAGTVHTDPTWTARFGA